MLTLLSKATWINNLNAHIHSPTAVSTTQGDSQLIGSSQGEGETPSSWGV